MSKVISIVNMKGGVGKTTLSVALADFVSAVLQKPVCLVDIDAQSNASFAIAGEERYQTFIQQGKTIDRFFLANGNVFGGTPLSSFVQHQVSRIDTQPPLSLIAASPRLRLVERQILIKLARQNLFDQELEGRAGKALREGLKDLTSEGVTVIIDSAPGISGFSTAALRASDMVIAPVNPDYLSSIGLQLLGRDVLPKLNVAQPPPLFAVLTKVRPNVTHPHLSWFTNAENQKQAGFTLLHTRVPLNADLGRAVEEGDIVQSFAQKYGSSAASVTQFGAEVIQRVGDL